MFHIVILEKDAFQIVEDDLDSPVGGIPRLGVMASSWRHNPDRHKGFFKRWPGRGAEPSSRSAGREKLKKTRRGTLAGVPRCGVTRRINDLCLCILLFGCYFFDRLRDSTQAVYYNAQRGVRTWLYVEEMQSLFAYPTVLNYFSRFSNEGRKFGLLLTGITQNATAMLENDAARNIVLNADFVMLLKQSPLDRMKWAELLNLSEQEEECIDESAEAGDGLLLAGGARVPIRGKFPQGNVLYDLFSTNPNEKKEKKHKKPKRPKLSDVMQDA